MDKQILIETHLFKVSPKQITEGVKTPTGNPMVEGILTTAEVKNGNGRYYSRSLWEREMDIYQTLISENRSLGELDHPDSQIINLKNSSHIIRKIWWNGDHVMGQIEILPTTSGNILKALIENNVTVGVSTRGMGTLKPMGELMEVQDDFSLLCFDFVSTPSNPGSYMKPTSLNENLTNNSINPYQKVNNIITDILCSNGTCPII